MNILHINPHDRKALAALSVLHGRCLPQAWSVEMLESTLTSPGALALVAESDGFEGFILLREILEEAEIITLGVLPEKRRRGIARSLLQEALMLCTNHGITSAWLEVAATNAGALALYKAEGFKQKGLRKGYYREGYDTPTDAVLMQRVF